MRVALVNPNVVRPPIGPIGLEYAAEALSASGHEVELLDLCWEAGPEAAVARFFSGREFGLIGISIRNTDDCSLSSRESFLPGHAAVVGCVRKHSGAPVVLGGVGFSVMPEAVLAHCGADMGIWGEGEFALPTLAGLMENGDAWEELPNLVTRRGGEWRRNPTRYNSLDELPSMSRGWADNRRYFREGGQAGIETKRGCPHRCVYCADPLAKGKAVRLRPPGAVADEVERLLDQGIDHVHTCDSEFNIHEVHAVEICEEFVRRGLGGRLRWYAYCSPVPFTAELAGLMRRAGCAGINFGVDSADDAILRRLGRDFTFADIQFAVRACRREGITVMLDLLLGSPGETRESIVRTIERVKKEGPDRAGIATGVRLYPGTEAARMAEKKESRGGRIGGDDLSQPVFFIEPAVAPFLFDLLDDLTRGDGRFLFFDPSRPQSNYNYNANTALTDAIGKGFRGAYWDILRRCADGGR